MASVIKTDFAYGAANIGSTATGTPTLANALRDGIDDVTELRTQLIALLAKMDTDFTAQNIAVGSSQLDEDYESVITPAVQGLTKG